MDNSFLGFSCALVDIFFCAYLFIAGAFFFGWGGRMVRYPTVLV